MNEVLKVPGELREAKNVSICLQKKNVMYQRHLIYNWNNWQLLKYFFYRSNSCVIIFIEKNGNLTFYTATQEFLSCNFTHVAIIKVEV